MKQALEEIEEILQICRISEKLMALNKHLINSQIHSTSKLPYYQWFFNNKPKFNFTDKIDLQKKINFYLMLILDYEKEIKTLNQLTKIEEEEKSGSKNIEVFECKEQCIQRLNKLKNQIG